MTQNYTPSAENIELLSRINDTWQGWSRFRTERHRNKRYTYGHQWDDIIDTPEGRMTEGEAMRREGETPMANNMIRRTVRNVVGVWRNNWAPRALLEGRPDATSLNNNMILNRATEVYARTLEEFLISGLAIHRKWHGRRGQVSASWTDFVSPDSFFMETDPRDFRGWDITMVGELHDMDFATLCARFATGATEAEALRAIYGAGDSRNRCRVVEVWRREPRPVTVCHDPVSGRLYRLTDATVRELHLENRRRSRSSLPLITSRREVEEIWTWSFLTPVGHTLASGDTPYAHGSHPFVVKAYPFIDGEIHSFVSDIIDQQRFTNRLITIYDRALRASAKGVLLFPEHALTPGSDLREVADQWSRADGVIMYGAKAGMPVPQQAGGLAAAPGISDLLQIQLKMIEDISGVNSALQGKLESSSTSGTLYERQTNNALTSIRDITDSFASFIAEGIEKDASNLRQFGC